MNKQKSVPPTGDKVEKAIQCPKCNMVFDLSLDNCPYCGEPKKIPFKAQPYESCGIREAREEQISDEIIEMFKDRNLSAESAIKVLSRATSKVVLLQEELDKTYRSSSPYKRSPS